MNVIVIGGGLSEAAHRMILALQVNFHQVTVVEDDWPEPEPFSPDLAFLYKVTLDEAYDELDALEAELKSIKQKAQHHPHNKNKLHARSTTANRGYANHRRARDSLNKRLPR